MGSKMFHSDLFYPYLSNQFYNVDHTVWRYDERSCFLMGFYMERQRAAEMKILNLFMKNRRDTDTHRVTAPTDADIIFATCHCEKLLCDRAPFRCGWDGSRIEWLWKLEHHQQQLHKAWQEHSIRSQKSRTSQTSSIIKLKKPNKKSCWTWLRHSCGYISDTESGDVPFTRSAISL